MNSYEVYLQDLLELKNKEIDLYKNFIEKQLRCTIQENVEKELICNGYRIKEEYFKTITIPESKFAIRIKYGFKEHWYYGTSYIRVKDDYPLYAVIITAKHRYIQIRDGNFGNIAGSLQDLLYDLIKDGLVEKV